MKVVVFFVLVILGYSEGARIKTLPSSFPLCSNSSEPRVYDDCLTKAVNEVFMSMKSEGIPSFGISSIDPLEVIEIVLAQGSGPVQLAMTLKNAFFHGFGSTKFSKMIFDRRINGNVNMYADGVIPEVQIIADYKIDGRILVLPIVGTGKCNITMRNIQIRTTLKNEIVTKNGEDYIKVNNFHNEIRPKNVLYQFDNLFGGDETFGREMNKFLNENSEQVYGEMRPVVEDAFGEVCKQLSNLVFLKVPYNKIFPQ